MKAKKFLSCMALSLLLVGCEAGISSQGTSSTTSDSGTSAVATSSAPSSESSSATLSSESSSTTSSSESLSESSSTTISTSSSAEGLTQTEVEERIGDITKLKTLFNSYSQIGIQSIKTEVQRVTKTISTLDTIDVSVRSSEILQITDSKDLTSENTTREISYNGYVNGVKYYVYDTPTYQFSESSKVYKTEDEIPEGDYSAMTEAQVLEQIENNISNATDLTKSTFGELFAESQEQSYGITGTVITSYTAILSGNEISILAKATANKYSGWGEKSFNGLYNYTFIATLDSNLIIKSGKLSYEEYDKNSVDADTHEVLDSATPFTSGYCELKDLTLGAIEKTGEEPMFDISKYYIQSLTNDAYVSSTVYNETTWEATKSKRNEVFVGSTIDLTIEDYDTEYNLIQYYLPTTACNVYDIKITGSSSPYIALDEYGTWTVSSDQEAIGQVVTLTIGSDVTPNIGTINVSIVASPIVSGGDDDNTTTPIINYDELAYLFDTNAGTFEGTTLSLYFIEEGMQTFLMIPTSNEGPFADYSSLFSVEIGDTDIASGYVDFETADAAGISDSIVISLSTWKIGETTIKVTETATGDPILYCYLNVVANPNN